MKLLSIVIPCFNEEVTITETIKRLQTLCINVIDLDVELIFIDDGSCDKTRNILLTYALKYQNIRLVLFARNFGHQLAVTAGIDASCGDAVVIIDADLQDPPEVILDMIIKWREGYEVVYGTRIDRPGESPLKIFTAHTFYRLLNLLSNVNIPVDTGDFRLMSRKVVDSLRSMPERDRFIRGMVSWIGFKQISIPYKRSERFAGESKYPFRKMLHFATDGILSFSTKPLQISISLGIICSSLSFVGILLALYFRIFTNTWVEGWTTLMIAVLFIGGVQLISVGILGEYIGRIYNEVKNRPLYIVEEYVGFEYNTPPLSRSPVNNLK